MQPTSHGAVSFNLNSPFKLDVDEFHFSRMPDVTIDSNYSRLHYPWTWLYSVTENQCSPSACIHGLPVDKTRPREHFCGCGCPSLLYRGLFMIEDYSLNFLDTLYSLEPDDPSPFIPHWRMLAHCYRHRLITLQSPKILFVNRIHWDLLPRTSMWTKIWYRSVECEFTFTSIWLCLSILKYKWK